MKKDIPISGYSVTGLLLSRYKYFCR